MSEGGVESAGATQLSGELSELCCGSLENLRRVDWHGCLRDDAAPIVDCARVLER